MRTTSGFVFTLSAENHTNTVRLWTQASVGHLPGTHARGRRTAAYELPMPLCPAGCVYIGDEHVIPSGCARKKRHNWQWAPVERAGEHLMRCVSGGGGGRLHAEYRTGGAQ